MTVSEKFKILSSRMPNYFLPQEDMEKSMKKLYGNYSEVSQKIHVKTLKEASCIN